MVGAWSRRDGSRSPRKKRRPPVSPFGGALRRQKTALHTYIAEYFDRAFTPRSESEQGTRAGRERTCLSLRSHLVSRRGLNRAKPYRTSSNESPRLRQRLCLPASEPRRGSPAWAWCTARTSLGGGVCARSRTRPGRARLRPTRCLADAMGDVRSPRVKTAFSLPTPLPLTHARAHTPPHTPPHVPSY